MAEILLGNIKGDKGDTGASFKVLEYYATLEELTASVPNPSVGDSYGVGSDYPYEIYVYSKKHGWVNNGTLQPDINEQTPNFEEATTLETLTSGEKISLAFGKIKKAITDLISHIADATKHITSDERTEWNGKAPGGCGLGKMAESIENVSFLDVMQQGGGFYQVSTSEDTPHSSKEWLSMMQIARQRNGDLPTGVQLAFYDFNPSQPKMWLRTIIAGTTGKWVEMLHTGNKGARIEKQSYTGNGLYGFENARTFTFSFQPTMLYISGYGRGGGNYTLTVPYGFPFAHTVVHTSDGGFAAMNCEFQYSGNSITMYNTTSANNGFNTDGKDYTIIAIG